MAFGLIENHDIKTTNHDKYLGVTITTKDLSLNMHQTFKIKCKNVCMLFSKNQRMERVQTKTPFVSS